MALGEIMRLLGALILCSLFIGYAWGEKMPWETDSYKQGEKERVSSILSSHPIENLRFVGVIASPSSPDLSVLVQIPSGATFPVKQGMRVGLNDGVISEITKSTIIVHESVPICGAHGFVEREVGISLPGMAKEKTVKYTVENNLNVCE